MANRPIVTTLCGSSRFPDAFALANMHLSMLGRVVISLGCFGHADYPIGARHLTSDGDETTPEKQHLDQLHFRKINISDGIFVVNPGGYVGSSTKREIAYAQSLGKTVEWLFPPAATASCDEHPQGEDPQGALGSRVLIQVIDSGYYYCAFNEGVTDRISDAFVYDLEEAEDIVRHDCATLRIIPAPCVSDEHPAGEDAIAAEGEACQRGGEAETPAQTPPSPPSATPEGDPPMTVEEARWIVTSFDNPARWANFYRTMEQLSKGDRDKAIWSSHASRIERALRTLQASESPSTKEASDA